MNAKDVQTVLNILKEEVIPVEGCTEPIALAYTGAKAKEILNDTVEKVTIIVSGNIIKNVKSVIIPNSGGMVGIDTSVVMGIVAGDSKRDLMVISDITKEKMIKVKEFLKTKKIEVIHKNIKAKLYIKIILESKSGSSSSVEIKHMHTNMTRIKKNGKVIFDHPCNDADFNSSTKDREILSVKMIYDLAKSIDITKIEDLFLKVIALNSKIAHEGLTGDYGVNIGKTISDNIEKGFYGDDARNRAASFASAGSDARMNGCSLPVMTTSGSGNQGMTASLALIKYAQINKISKEKLIRALFFSHLTTIHIKTNVGRLSAYCGVVCASAAVAGALAFLNKESYKVVAHSIINTLGDISGIICDGAKSSCAMKISTTIYAAFDSYLLASKGRFLKGGEGIIASDIEKTLKNIGKLSQIGMNITDKTIIEIMANPSCS